VPLASVAGAQEFVLPPCTCTVNKSHLAEKLHSLHATVASSNGLTWTVVACMDLSATGLHFITPLALPFPGKRLLASESSYRERYRYENMAHRTERRLVLPPYIRTDTCIHVLGWSKGWWWVARTSAAPALGTALPGRRDELPNKDSHVLTGSSTRRCPTYPLRPQVGRCAPGGKRNCG